MNSVGGGVLLAYDLARVVDIVGLTGAATGQRAQISHLPARVQKGVNLPPGEMSASPTTWPELLILQA